MAANTQAWTQLDTIERSNPHYNVPPCPWPYFTSGRAALFLNRMVMPVVGLTGRYRRPTASLTSDSGQSLVEFALVITVLFLLLFGIVQVGSALHAYMVISQASREGARVGVVGGSDEDVIQAVVAQCSHLDQDILSVEVIPPESDRTRGSALRVRVGYEYIVGEGLIASIVGGSLSLSAESVMRVE